MGKRILLAIGGVLLLAGCSVTGEKLNELTPQPVSSPVESNESAFSANHAVPVNDSRDELEASLRSVFDEYLRLSALIASEGGDNPERIEVVTSNDWAEIEKQSSTALREMGSKLSGEMTVAKWEIASTRGRLRILDALVHACLSRDSIKVTDSSGVETAVSGTTLVTIHFVGSDGGFVVDDISPWENSAWCAA